MTEYPKRKHIQTDPDQEYCDCGHTMLYHDGIVKDHLHNLFVKIEYWRHSGQCDVCMCPKFTSTGRYKE
jgi:hypothetical protein